MSVRIDAGGDYLMRTANLPLPSLLSWCGWVYLTTDRNASGVFFLISNDIGSQIQAVGPSSSGTTLQLRINGADAGSGTDLATATWYHIGYTRNDATHNVYLNGVLNFTASNNNTLTTPVVITQGSDGALFFDGRLAALKCWDAELTANEMLSEMWSYLPRRLANLNYACPCLQASLLTDVGPNGRSLTGVGTLTTEDNPPITWAPRRWRIWRPGAPAETATPPRPIIVRQAVKRASSF